MSINNVKSSFSLVQISNFNFVGVQFLRQKLLLDTFHCMNDFCTLLLELKAVLFKLKSLCSHLKQTYIKKLTDKTTAMCTKNNMSSCKSLLFDQEVRRTCSWILKNHFYYSISCSWYSQSREKSDTKKIRIKNKIEVI